MKLVIDTMHLDPKASKVSAQYYYWAQHLQKYIPFVEYEKINKSIYSWYLQFKIIGIPTLVIKSKE
jgi:hypothetical protein